MKKQILALLALIVLAAPLHASGIGRATACVRMRSGTSFDRAVLECLEPGTRLRVLGSIGGWSQVQLLDGSEGWVSSGYLEAAPAILAAEPTADVQGQLEPTDDLQGQLEEALAAAESRLVRVAGLNAEQERRIEGPDAALAAARTREADQQQALSAVEERLRTAEGTSANKARRIAQLEAAPPPAPPRRAALKRELKVARALLRQTEATNAEQARRIAQLEAALSAAPATKTGLRQDLAAAESRLGTAEQTNAEQATRMAALTGELADAELKLAEVEVKSRLAAWPAAADGPGDGLIRVREPIAAASEPPKVAVRVPVAMREEVAVPAEAPAEQTESSTEAAIHAVRAWAAAWSDQRVDDYLSLYARGFRTPNGLSRREWKAQRRQRLSVPSYIRVTISALRAEADAGTVQVTFRQEYESDRLGDAVTKEMTLVEERGAWRILVEQATP